MPHIPPQPSPSRLTDFAGHSVVVGVVPGQPELVALTAASLARAIGGTLYFGYVDTSRITEEEYPDGTVRHVAIEPDLADDTWMETEQHILSHLSRAMADQGVRWEFRYLAGSPQRSLTHLARAVDAAVIVVGTRAPGAGARLREFVESSVALRLGQHQHRPVLVVPLSVVDWKARAPWE
ncbi:MAG: universal stress protein [Actinomycetales bacterium]|nr:universal stress protein [Actinomycetales bacterium]